jgi:hypothetical protein
MQRFEGAAFEHLADQYGLPGVWLECFKDSYSTSYGTFFMVIMVSVKSIIRYPFLLAMVIAVFCLMTTSSAQAESIPARAEILSADVQFDYFSWTINAVWQKIQFDAMGMPSYLNNEERKRAVYDYIQITRDIEGHEAKLDQLYADPSIQNKEKSTETLRSELNALTNKQQALAPFAESVVQDQVSTVVAELGLTTGGQPIPAVLYHVSPLPLALIISPRDQIQQDGDLSLLPDLTVENREQLEGNVDHQLGVSSLIVPVGGIGAYPTMVMRTSDLRWLSEVVSHEWTHNFLTLRPLGIRYDLTPEMRTMNETTASISGKEIGQRVIQEFYPELLASEQSGSGLVSDTHRPPGPGDFRQPFDFRKEMHETRVTVDQLLADGKINDAEKYMEARRQVFWDNGYALRKLNQAYFAFYGAYADVPGGAAGEDPVGPAVRALREKSSSLSDFLYRISRMTSFDELKAAVQ